MSPHLIAKFYALKSTPSEDQKRVLWRRDPDSKEVWALITEGTAEHTINWNSPFENVGVDQQFSAISSLLQTGALVQGLSNIKKLLGLGDDGGDNVLSRSFEGRSSVTKLNSRQVFNGLPPLKITLTAHFRALVDPSIEVEAPIEQLISWALPQEMAEDSITGAALKGEAQGLFPSLIPKLIAMEYAGARFLPLVIEAIPYPLTAPRHRSGQMLSAQLTMTLATLSALDAKDWAGFMRPTK